MCTLDVSLSLSPRLSPIQALGLEKTWHDHSHDSGVSGYASQIKLGIPRASSEACPSCPDFWNEELISTKDDQLEELRYDLQLLHASTSTTSVTSGLPAVAEISRAQRRSELRQWLQETTSRSGRQRIFPELDLMVSTLLGID